MVVASRFGSQLTGRGIRDARVLAAMEKVPREEFVPAEYAEQAYGDFPLPIGHGQTISQPYIVALMTEMLALSSADRVLEIGTGSGYQAAVLSEMAAEVYTIEAIDSLCQEARARLARLGYEQVHVTCGDGYFGWPEYAPYNGIVAACAPDHIPPALVEQLAAGGRLVIPVGPPGGAQYLWLVCKRGDRIEKRQVTAVAFVPLIAVRRH